MAPHPAPYLAFSAHHSSSPKPCRNFEKTTENGKEKPWSVQSARKAIYAKASSALQRARASVAARRAGGADQGGVVRVVFAGVLVLAGRGDDLESAVEGE